jgi:tight adherence protein C
MIELLQDWVLRYGVMIAAALLALGAAGLVAVGAREALVRSDVQKRLGPTTDLPIVLDSDRRVPLEDLMRRLGKASAPAGKDDTELRRRLRLAGFDRPAAVVIFYGLRLLLTISLAVLALIVYAATQHTGLTPTSALLSSAMGAGLGWIAPSFLLDSRVSSLRREYQEGFPDVLDLLVVCVEAGMGVEAGLTRICDQLDESYPNLRRNLALTLMELRAGRDRTTAFKDLGDRLGIDEAVGFGRLIVQTEQLGSSISQTLRVAAEDMRTKRLMRAEETAMSLPVRLTVPLAVFIFPGIMVVTLLPAMINIYDTFIMGGLRNPGG